MSTEMPSAINPNRSREAEEAEFQKQFNNRETFEFPGGKIEVVDIMPENPKTEVPVAAMPGWGGTPDVLKDNIEALSESGRRVLSVNSPHGIGHDLKNMENTKDMPDVILRKVAALAVILEEKRIGKLDMNAHSMGCIEAVIFAKLFPDKVIGRTLVLMDPPMVGKDTWFRLATRFTYDTVKQNFESYKKARLKKNMNLAKVVSKSVISNPVRALYDEVYAIAHTQIQDMLLELQEMGVNVVVVHGAHEDAFPMMRVQKMSNPVYEEAAEEALEASTEELAETMPEIKATRMNGFISIKGKHAEAILDGNRMGRITDHILASIENRK